jgi:prepilin signal peptidase PulO-like enzyme (type II secretory pathway)
MTLSLLLWALLGLVAGGIAYRLADWLLERPARSGASLLPRCARCGRTQTPLHRLALLRRPCPGCGLPPPREQAAVEVVTALLVALLRLRLGDDLATAVPALATFVLVTATLTDLRARLIPNALTYPGTLLALAASLLTGGVGPLPALLPGGVGPGQALLGMLAAGGLAALIWLGGRLVYRRGDVFGLGDVKLSLFIGAVTGLSRALTAMVTGIVVGGLLGVLVLLRGRSTRATMPYGPALAIGAYLTLLLGAP